MNWWKSTTTRLSKHALKLTQLNLELGLFGTRVASPNDKVAIEITGEAAAKRRCTCTHITSCRRFLSNKTSSLNWDTPELRSFNLVHKEDAVSSVSYNMEFHVLHGKGDAVGEITKAKMTVVGKASVTVDMAELLAGERMKTGSSSHNHHHLQRKLPIHLKVNGLIIEATLLVCMRLMKLDDLQGPFENSIHSEKKSGIIGKLKSLTCLGRKNNVKVDQSEQPSPYESYSSPVFYSDDSSNESTASSNSSKSDGFHNSESRLGFRSSGTKTPLDTSQSNWSYMSRNRSFKGWNTKTDASKQETSTTDPCPLTKSEEHSLQFYLQDSTSSWGVKEFSSRDGKSKLKTNVFFASFDQRSEKASGESACTVLVALIAHWLHSNKGMPTRAEFDSLITQGSSEWRRLCNSNYYSKLFPDKHFDLETIIDANLRPLVVLPQKSYTGFFSPEKFHCLKGAMSFDEIWDEINTNVVGVYIVSWNDHFFVLKVEADAYYIIDSLGERLFEGCNQAFMLKFDESCVMYGEVEEEGPLKASVGGARSAESEKSLEVVCRGKECCKEFIKRFLAAIPVRQLEKEETKKWAVSSTYLHRQLQIDFHYSTSSSSLSSTPASMLSFLTRGL